MRQVNIHHAKTHLSRLLEEIAEGVEEEIVIAKAGKPVARLVAIAAKAPDARRPGRFKGQITIGDDFDDPLPADIARGFGQDIPTS